MAIPTALLEGWAGASTEQEGRTQLTSKFKNDMRKALAEATKESEAAFDFRSLNSSAQTTRASSESMGARSAAGREKKSWIFLGRVSEKEDAIADTLRNRLGKVCSVAILFSKAKGWAPYAVQYHPNYKALSDSLSLALGLDPTKALVFNDIAGTDDDEPTDTKALPSSDDIFLEDDEFQDILRNLKRKKNVILTGPPGTGKTFIAEKLAHHIMSGAEDASLTKIQFHPSYSYEDFVRGWRPAENGFTVADGVLVRIASDAADNPKSQHVLLIDEINRANVTKVFGELLSLVESTKRGPKFALTLPNGRQQSTETEDDSSFYLPANVHLIGTMNTADRSIAMVDFALRRRFSFFYIKPAFDSPKFQSLLCLSGLSKSFVSELATVMADLNRAIIESSALGQGYEIGHSYFVPDAIIPDPGQWFRDIVETELCPLLAEYWFEDDGVADHWSQRLRGLKPFPAEEAPIVVQDDVAVAAAVGPAT
jgi:hypothetical protein